VMASANVDLVRSIYANWERGDFSRVDWAHPEIEYVMGDGPTPGRWKGDAGLREGFHHFVGAWDKLRVSAREYRELDEERVLVFTRLRGRGKRSGLELEQMQGGGADVLHIRDGKVTRLVTYADPKRAFADLGLKE
jgi:ketosteroid isomerase-like protein